MEYIDFASGMLVGGLIGIALGALLIGVLLDLID